MNDTAEAAGCDILILGSGYFAEVMVADLALAANTPLRVVIGGRNAARCGWLALAGNSRAALHGRPARFDSASVDFDSPDRLDAVLGRLQPRVVVQSASMQSPWKVDVLDSEWSRVVAEGGFGITIAFHSVLSARTAAAVARTVPGAHFVNTCYPDGVNPLLARAGLPVATGVGNVSIYSSVIAGLLRPEERQHLRVLGHHHHLVQWRRTPGTRSGAPVRAWVDGVEIVDTEALTGHLQLPYRDLNLISGGGAVPVLLGLAGAWSGRAHVPGPRGLPGGYPVQVSQAGVTLDLPPGLTEAEAIAWNRGFDEADGVSVENDGRVVYSAAGQRALARHSAELAQGFNVGAVEEAARELGDLRARLGG
ncbi:hypothetical protein [Chelatococcus asaccharovorans]|uniref:Saccharopine dehydrogenase-like protein n=1 Tax=Chelatococcus asaccharovorans TaxID=28210 RepID=A0A2V3U0F9_9HYPH|nr:hypothetical protein [Chelatococcus asaccharovorans]MBS7707741.1 hypothetical protein [Chelatococcus asaccharovorans]PXW55318.1 hypothetical protein C7450_110257 [Chelatococcus asaccharovorans]